MSAEKVQAEIANGMREFVSSSTKHFLLKIRCSELQWYLFLSVFRIEAMPFGNGITSPITFVNFLSIWNH